MDQSATGRFIARKRKEKNLTQQQLAQQLGVSNKTVSKWETGTCMPDYSLVKPLCSALGITLAELMDGREQEARPREYDEEMILELLRRTQALEHQKHTLYGILLMVMGVALLAVSQTFGGSDFKDFLSGLLLGMSTAEMLVGTYVAVTSVVATSAVKEEKREKPEREPSKPSS